MIKRILPILTANAVTPLCSLLSGPILAYGLGPGGRGEYATLTVPIVFIGIAGTLGFQDGITYAVARVGWTPYSVRKMIPRLGLLLCVLSVGVLLGLGYFITKDTPTLRTPFMLLTLTAPFQIFTGLYAGLLVGAEEYGPVNRSKIVAAVGRLLMLAVLLVSGTLSSVSAAVVHMAASGFGLLVLVYMSKSLKPPIRLAVRNFSLSKYSLVAAPAIIVSLAALRLDQVIALPLIGTEQLGFYAAAVGIAETTVILATTVRTVILGGRSDLQSYKQQRKLTVLAFLGSILIAVVGIVLARPAIGILLGSEFEPAYTACVIVIIGNVALAGCQLSSGWLLRYNKAGWQSIAFSIGCVANVIAIVILRDYGAIGAAIASAINYSIALAIMTYALYGGTSKTSSSNITQTKVTIDD